MEIEIGKSYRTSNGYKVDIHKIYKGDHLYPIHATIHNRDSGELLMEEFTLDGKYYADGSSHPYDLIEETPYNHLYIDDKVLVSHDGVTWKKRHFAGVDTQGKPTTFTDGKTSFTAGTEGTATWRYCKRYE